MQQKADAAKQMQQTTRVQRNRSGQANARQQQLIGNKSRCRRNQCNSSSRRSQQQSRRSQIKLQWQAAAAADHNNKADAAGSMQWQQQQLICFEQTQLETAANDT
jgi:hypothetical protein